MCSEGNFLALDWHSLLSHIRLCHTFLRLNPKWLSGTNRVYTNACNKHNNELIHWSEACRPSKTIKRRIEIRTCKFQRSRFLHCQNLKCHIILPSFALCIFFLARLLESARVTSKICFYSPTATQFSINALFSHFLSDFSAETLSRDMKRSDRSWWIFKSVFCALFHIQSVDG